MAYNFTHTAFSFEASSPVDNGKWVEADAAAGIGWLAFMGSRLSSGASERGHESELQLECARKSIAALERMTWNPLYEMQLPFGALTAARLNAEAGGSADVHKLVSWSLTPDEPAGSHLPGAPTGVTRSGWGAVAGRWGGKTVDGLIGSSLDGDGYAFFGNTAWFFAALSPLPRYDYRFADALGKWMTAVAVNARYFYPDQLGDRQSGPVNWKEDPDSVIPYEGLRKCDWSRPANKCLHGPDWGPFGTGQNCGDAGVAAGSGKCRPVPTIPYQASTDRGLYGGMYIGLISGAVYHTNHSNVLQFDLCANDRFAPASFPTALLYNPLVTSQLVVMNMTAAQRAFGARSAVDIYESTSDRVILKDRTLTSDVVVEVPAGQAIIAVAMPAHSTLVRALDGQVSVPVKSAGGQSTVVVRFCVPPTKTDDGNDGANADGSGQPRLSLDITSEGNFSVSVSGAVWLAGLRPAVHTEGAWQRFALTSPTASSGIDGIGAYTMKVFVVHERAGREIELMFREYSGGQTIVFAMRFPSGANGTRTTDSTTACKNCDWPTTANNYTGCLGTSQGTQCAIEPATKFPSFALDRGKLPSLGFKTWEFTFGVDHSSSHSSSTGAATEAGFGATVRRNGNTDLDPAGWSRVTLAFRQRAMTARLARLGCKSLRNDTE
jgi:hypothetical protein